MAYKWIPIGTQVTCRRSEPAYGSGYGMNPVCHFEPGDVGVVGAVDVPSVTRNRVAFYCVDFEKDGRKWRCALDKDNIVRRPLTNQKKGPY